MIVETKLVMQSSEQKLDANSTDDRMGKVGKTSETQWKKIKKLMSLSNYMETEIFIILLYMNDQYCLQQ